MKLSKAYAFMVDGTLYREAYIYGGRISGKTRGVATALLVAALQEYQRRQTPFNVLVSRALQSSIRDSFLGTLKTVCMDNPEIAQYYDSGELYFRGKDIPINFVFKGTNANAEEIKGLDNIALSVFEEADTISAQALQLVLPTVLREQNAKAVFIFNPSLPDTPIAQRLIGHIGRENLYKKNIQIGDIAARWVNWQDNGFLTETAKKSIAADKAIMAPELYKNVYEGYFTTTLAGAYYAAELADIYASGRFAKLQADYNAPYYATFDLGLNDLTTCWIFQISRECVNILRYFAYAGTNFGDVLDDIAAHGFPQPIIVLPHDGDALRGYVTLATPKIIARDRGLAVIIVPRAASKKQRIDAVREILPFCRFDNIWTLKGLNEVKHYAPKIVNGVALDSPDHKYSDAADALGGVPYIFNRVHTIGRLDFSGTVFN